MRAESVSSKIGSWLLEHLPWIFLILGVLTIGIGTVLPDNLGGQIEPEWLCAFLNKVPTAIRSMGATVLGAGIFAAVLKSFQFSGIFQRELSKVIYNSEYLARQDRQYVEHLWGIVTDALFTNKFPSIKNEISEPIISVYLPTDHNFHYENYSVIYSNLRLVKEANGKEYVEYTVTLNGDIRPGVNEKKLPIRNAVSMTTDNTESREIECLILYEDDKVFKDFTDEIIKEAKGIKEKFREELKPTKYNYVHIFEKSIDIKPSIHHYHIKKVERRKSRLDLQDNELLIFEASRVTYGMYVDIQYDPKTVEVSFVSKTVKDFILLIRRDEEGRMAFRNANVILPSQGYSIVLRRPKPNGMKDKESL